ncbi:MAG: hypothetical protein QOE13_3442 [Gaiellaceae bacterium]|jgi:hypothetical protein|nr:hypothetical protein [Gaiellaceae bacterium]
MPTSLLALSWNPQVRGGLYVFLAVVILCGSGFLILSTNLGGRLGFQAAAAGLTGFLVIIGSVWWVYGIGPHGKAPTWVPKFVVQGDLGQTGGEILAGFPRGWEKLDLADPAVADALPVSDSALTDSATGTFKSSSDFLPVAALEKGGDSHGPFGVFNFRPLNLFHSVHYLVIQVQAVEHQEATPGLAPPKPRVDPNATPVSVVMVRDLGSLRLNPGVFTLAVGSLFGLLVYQLHTRDKELMALRAKQ